MKWAFIQREFRIGKCFLVPQIKFFYAIVPTGVLAIVFKVMGRNSWKCENMADKIRRIFTETTRQRKLHLIPPVLESKMLLWMYTIFFWNHSLYLFISFCFLVGIRMVKKVVFIVKWSLKHFLSYRKRRRPFYFFKITY